MLHIADFVTMPKDCEEAIESMHGVHALYMF